MKLDQMEIIEVVVTSGSAQQEQLQVLSELELVLVGGGIGETTL